MIHKARDGQEVTEVLQKLYGIFSWQETLTAPTRSNVIIKEMFLLDLKATQPFTEIPKFNKSLCFISYYYTALSYK
jgi:hypothetical protein